MTFRLMDYYSEAEFFEKAQDLDLLSSCLENIFYPFILARGHGTLFFIDFNSVGYLLFRMKKICFMQTDICKKTNMVEKANRRLNDLLSISGFISFRTHNEKEYLNDLLLVSSKHSEIIQGKGKKDRGLHDYHFFGDTIRILEELKHNGILIDFNELATAYLNRGVTYKANGKYDKALRDYGECIRIMKNLQEQGRLNNPHELATAYLNRGVTYYEVGKYDEALYDYGECIRIMEALQEQGRLSCRARSRA